ADLGAERLVIEISERAPLPDLYAARANLRALHALGVRVALDDFGTGDAGLDYLRHLPVDYLKLEAVFVSDVDRSPETGALARAVIELGQTMGMQIVAEGIERQAQDEWARESGCDLVQGFLHGRPETIEKLIG
ncbi:MAG: EAL domain-containing protein, partial [Gemmatimonadota bacterium]